MLDAAFKSHIARIKCPKVSVTYEPKEVLPVTDLVSPRLMLKVVMKYDAPTKSCQNPSSRSPNANHALKVDRFGELSI